MASKKNENIGKPTGDALKNRKIKVHMDESDLETVYANVSNVWGTREELMVDFGMSSLHRGAPPSISVHLNKRIVLTPFNAKRLAIMMAQAVKKYEGEYGEISLAKATASPDIAYSSEDITSTPQ